MLPIVATLLSQGFSLFAGAVASRGAEYVKEKTGVDLASALGTESGRFQLKQLEAQHEQFLIDAAGKADALALDYFKTEVADRDSARTREVGVATARGAPWYAPSTLTILTFVVVLGGGWMFVTIEETDVRYAIVSVITMVLSYYYGTTKGSADKSAVMASIVKAQS